MNEDLTCQACGAPVGPGHQFCRSCGSMVGGDDLEIEQKVALAIPLKKGKRISILRIILLFFLCMFVLGIIGAILTPPNVPRKPARQKACMANMRVLEGGIDMWEMDTDGERMPSGLIGSYKGDMGEVGRRLVPTYVKKLPRCRERGDYYYDNENYTVSCTRHNTVDDPRMPE